MQLQDDYFAPYSLRLTRDAEGVRRRRSAPENIANIRVPVIAAIERIVREVGHGLSLEGASAADLVRKEKSHETRSPKT
jgi:hypothetical protein